MQRLADMNVGQFRQQLAELCTEPDYMRVIADGLARLIPTSFACVYDLTEQGEQGHIGHLLSRTGTDWSGFPGHQHIPGLRRYGMRKDSPDAKWVNRAVETRRLYHGDPEALSKFRENILGPGGVHYQLRVVIYDPVGRFRGLCAVMRSKREGEFSEDEVERLQRVTPLLLDALLAVAAVGTARMSRDELAGMLEAFQQPAYLVSPMANVVYRNRRAAVYSRAPGWIRHCLDATREGKRFALAQAHRIEVEGQTLWVVIQRPESERVAPDLGTLPPSLRSVAELLAQGLSDKEIAVVLDRPLSTVRTYVQRVFARLQVQSRRELMRGTR